MPMLPSGRKVAVDPSPFWALLKAIDSPLNTHKIMAIRDWSGVLPWIDVLLLFDETEATPEVQRQAAEDPVSDAPPGMVVIRSGYRLDRWRDLAAGWPQGDVRAMAEFVEGRVCPQFLPLIDKAAEAQRILLGPLDNEASLFAHMWAQGVHPLQEKSAENGDQLH